MGNKHVLLFFDDQVADKDQEYILFLVGKLAEVSRWFIHLNRFFAITVLIIKQFIYVIIVKFSEKRDLNLQ